MWSSYGVVPYCGPVNINHFVPLLQCVAGATAECTDSQLPAAETECSPSPCVDAAAEPVDQELSAAEIHVESVDVPKQVRDDVLTDFHVADHELQPTKLTATCKYLSVCVSFGFVSLVSLFIVKAHLSCAHDFRLFISLGQYSVPFGLTVLCGLS